MVTSNIINLSSGDKIHVHYREAEDQHEAQVSLFMETAGRTMLVKLNQEDTKALLSCLQRSVPLDD